MIAQEQQKLILPYSLKDGGKTHTHTHTPYMHKQVHTSVYQSALCATHPSVILMATGDTCKHWISMARNLVIQANCKMNLNLLFILIFQPIFFLHEFPKKLIHSKYIRKLKSIHSNENSCSSVIQEKQSSCPQLQ